MAGSWPSNLGQGNFIPSTFDITSLDPSSKEYQIKIYQIFSQIILALNQKSSGLFQFDETVDNNLWAPIPATVDSAAAQTATQRAEFRKVIDFGALPNNSEKPIAHGIAFDSTFTMTHMYATTTNPTTLNYRQIPYVSEDATELITLRADGTNVYIETFKDLTAFTRTFVVLLYLKN